MSALWLQIGFVSQITAFGQVVPSIICYYLLMRLDLYVQMSLVYLPLLLWKQPRPVIV